MAAVSAEISNLSNENVVDLLKGEFFRENGDASSRAPLFTVRENVPAMRKDFEAAGAGRDAIRFDRDTKVFYLGLTGVKPDRSKEIFGVLQDYGIGSPGEVAWKAERAEQARLEAVTKAALKSEVVRTGAAVDLRSHKEGAVEAGLVEAGLDSGAAAVVAREFVDIEDRHSRAAGLSGTEMPSDESMLAEAHDSVMADIDAAFARHEELDAGKAAELAAMEETRANTMFDYVKSVGGFKIAPDDELSTPVPNGAVADAMLMRTFDANGQDAIWHMRFKDQSAEPISVTLQGTDAEFAARQEKAVTLLSGYFAGFKRESISFDVAREPSDAHSLRVISDDKQQRQTWVLAFDGASVRGITCDENEVTENALLAAAANRGATLDRVANRLGASPEKPDRVVLTVPPSERDEFERIKSEKGAVTKYDSKANNGFGRPGGWYLIEGNAADFEKWRGPDAHAKFVSEGNERYRGQATLADEAKVTYAESQGKPFAHFERGVMLHAKQEDAQKFIEGFVDNVGRQKRGLKEASADELRTLAEATSKSYTELERKESVIRLEVLVKNSASWKSRYDGVQGSHEEKIEGLLPRVAVDGKPGFRGLNHDQNRQAWKVNGEEAGLATNEKRTMSSLHRGFGYLRERYQEVSGRPLDFTLTGVKLALVETRKEVAAEAKLEPAKPNEAAKNKLAASMLGNKSAGRDR